jgi:GAG-pre-integrase domain
VVQCPYNESNLPELTLSTPHEADRNLSALNACVMLENNQNLTVAQKELLKWHCRLGHLSLRRVPLLMRSGAVGHSPRIKAVANLDLFKFPVICGACAYGKAKKKPTRRSKTDKDCPSLEKELSKEILIPGQKVSMDHFPVSTPGRACNSRGSDSQDKMFKGGGIFVDHASSYVFVVPVVNFTCGEAKRARREFEHEMASMGVVALHYHTDNGVFTTAEFQYELAKLNQGLSLSGVGVHHQNAVAERAIGTVVSLARTMMLHSKMRWPKEVSTKLWPMAMKHAEFIVNHVPNQNNVCPLDVVLKTVVTRDQHKNLHVWDSPCYVLDPKLQDGKKIPKFEPRSR